jgi:hypothetical protein
MNQIELPEGSPAKAYHIGVERESAIVCESGKINSLDPIFLSAPAPFAGLEGGVEGFMASQAEIRGEDGDLMAAFDEAVSERADFDDGTTAVLEREIRLNSF